jgi:hypothetical protein
VSEFNWEHDGYESSTSYWNYSAGVYIDNNTVEAFTYIDGKRYASAKFESDRVCSLKMRWQAMDWAEKTLRDMMAKIEKNKETP